MQPGVLLGSGREADVYAIDGERVLRRYRTGADTAAEADVMAYVAGHGFPVPHVYGAEGPDLVRERLDGPTMLRALASGEVETAAGAAILAGLHSRLHRIPARRSTESGATILHRDLHPENVMLTSHGPVVIDWRNAIEGRRRWTSR